MKAITIPINTIWGLRAHRQLRSYGAREKYNKITIIMSIDRYWGSRAHRQLGSYGAREKKTYLAFVESNEMFFCHLLYIIF